MARYKFGSAASDFAIQPPSAHGDQVFSAPNRSGTAWSDITGGTQYTDLIAIEGGTPPTTDADGWINRFEGPDGVIEMWVEFGADRFLIRTTDDIGNPDDAVLYTAQTPTESEKRTALVNVGTARLITPEQFGAVGDGSDETTELNNALQAAKSAGGGTVYCEKLYGWTGDLVIPRGVVLLGPGSSEDSTVGLVALNTTSRLYVGHWTSGDTHPGGLSQMTVTGNSTGGAADGCVHVEAVRGAMDHVLIKDMAGIGMVLNAAQNMHFDSVDVTRAAGGNVRLINGAGGLKFTRCSNTPGGTGYALMIDDPDGTMNNGYPFGSSHIEWDTCIFEQAVPNTSPDFIRIDCGANLLFHNCGISNDNVAMSTPAMVTISNNSFPTILTQAAFDTCNWNGGPTAKTPALRILGNNRAKFQGEHYFQQHSALFLNDGGAGQLAWDSTQFYGGGAPAANSRISDINGGSGVGRLTVKEQGIEYAIADNQTYPLIFRRATDGAGAMRGVITRDGGIGFGDGTSFTIQDSIGWNATNDNVDASSLMIQGRRGAYPHVWQAPGVGASFTLDSKATTIYRFAMASTATITSLTVTNPLEGAELTLQFSATDTTNTVTWPSNFAFARNSPPVIGVDAIAGGGAPFTIDFRYDASTSKWNEISRSMPGLTARQIDLPSYITAPLQHWYNPRTSGYNQTGDTLHPMRAKEALLIGGVQDLHMLWLGDSTLGGYDGNAYQVDTNVVREAGRQLANDLGVTFQGGIQLAAGDSSPRVANNVTLTGSFVPTSVFVASNGVGTLVVNMLDAGTTVEWTCSDLTTATVNWKIDGVAQTAVTLTNTNTIRKVQKTGLSNTAHTLEIDSGTGQVVIVTGWRAYDPSVKRLHVHNCSIGGTRANSGTNNLNWSSMSSASPYGVGWVVTNTIAAFGVTPDLLGISIGANDISAGTAPATAVAGISTMRGYYASSPLALLHSYMIAGTNQANWDAFTNLEYQAAETLGAMMIDWDAYVGRAAGALADGLIGLDGIHPNKAHQRLIGHHVGDMLAV